MIQIWWQIIPKIFVICILDKHCPFRQIHEERTNRNNQILIFTRSIRWAFAKFDRTLYFRAQILNINLFVVCCLLVWFSENALIVIHRTQYIDFMWLPLFEIFIFVLAIFDIFLLIVNVQLDPHQFNILIRLRIQLVGFLKLINCLNNNLDSKEIFRSLIITFRKYRCLKCLEFALALNRKAMWSRYWRILWQ